MTPLNPENQPVLSSPLFYPLTEPLSPGKRLKLEVTFRKTVQFSAEDTEFGEAEGVLITILATEKGAKAAAACLDTAVDVIESCQEWLGFYPFAFLNIIPGGRGRWGGYPFATGIVVIHGQETFKEGEPLVWWQHITSHEIGHEYWGEWVLDPDNPAWLWIGMGIFIDTEYMMARHLEPERRARWMGNYLNGLRVYYDMTVDIPPDQVEEIRYDHDNTVIHYPESFDCFERVAGLQREGLEKFAALGWMGLLKDLLGKRPEALDFYREALKFDTGESMRHDQLGIQIDKKWVEERLRQPFVWKKQPNTAISYS